MECRGLTITELFNASTEMVLRQFLQTTGDVLHVKGQKL